MILLQDVNGFFLENFYNKILMMKIGVKKILHYMSIHPSNWIRDICVHTGYYGISFYHKYVYYIERRHWPDFKHPKDFSEHLLAAMSKPSFTKYAPYADKVKVRDYIQSKGLGDCLLDIYGVWEDARDIDFVALPEKFALKPNNGSGGHFFCKDKSKINKELIIKQLNDALLMVKNEKAFKFEPHYAKIPPLIYCEELIDTGTDAWPVDYKFTCVHGKICDVFVSVERDTGCTKYCTLDVDYYPLPYTREEYLPKSIPPKPKHFERMKEIAKILSKDFECVRVDLYEYKDRVFFSELTFSPWGGFMYSYNQNGLDEIGEAFNE